MWKKLLTICFCLKVLLSVAQSSKMANPKGEANTTDDLNDIVLVFHGINENEFVDLPASDDDLQVKKFYKDLSFWLAQHGNELSDKINTQQISGFKLYRSAIRRLDSKTQIEFKSFYSGLNDYINFIVNQRILPEKHIVLPQSILNTLQGFFEK